MSNVLAIGDLHTPFEHKDSLAFIKAVNDRYGPFDAVVCLGDEIDAHSLSDYDHDPDGLSPGHELRKAIKHLKPLYNLFPAVLVCVSNHTARPYRKALKHGIPRAFLRDYREFLEAPEGWEWSHSWEIDNVIYEHGEGFSGQLAAIKAAQGNMQSTVIGHIHCVQANYEVLTPNGFKPITEVMIGETVLGYSDGRIVPTIARDVIRGNHTGTMYEFYLTKFKQFVTDKHRIIRKDGSWEYAHDLHKIKQHQLPISASPMSAGTEMEIDDNLLRLLVAVAADGSYDGHGNDDTIRFHLKKQRKIDRLTMLIKALGFNIEWSIANNGAQKSKELSRELRKIVRDLMPNKQIPEFVLNLSARQRQVVIDELHLWDGSDVSKYCVDTNSYQYCSTRPEELDRVQLLLALNGIFSRKIRGNTLTYNDKQSLQCDRSLADASEMKQVIDFPVACLTTDTGNFIIRTDEGTVEVTGNSHAGIIYSANPKHLIFGFNVGCLIDRDQYAFAYGAKLKSKPIIGVGLIQEGIPTFIPMQLNANGRWSKKL